MPEGADLPERITVLRLTDGVDRIAYAAREVLDISMLSNELKRVTGQAGVAGITLIDGETAELVDCHALFAQHVVRHRGRADADLPAWPATKAGCAASSAPIIEAAGYRIVEGEAPADIAFVDGGADDERRARGAQGDPPDRRTQRRRRRRGHLPLRPRGADGGPAARGRGARRVNDMLLVVVLAGRRAALPAIEVNSVIELAEVTPVPRAAPHIAGLAALRSRPLTVIDCLDLARHRPAMATGAARRRAVVIEHEGPSLRPAGRRGRRHRRRARRTGTARCRSGARVGAASPPGRVETEAGALLLLDVGQLDRRVRRSGSAA